MSPVEESPPFRQKKEFETRTFLYRIGATVAVFFALTLVIGNVIAGYHLEKLQADETEFLFRSIESGPLSFARLQSVELARQALERLMGSGSELARGVRSVEILGGEGFRYSYASWVGGETASAPPECLLRTERNYTYPDAVHAFRVGIGIDRCRFVRGFSEMRWVSIFLVLLLSCVMLSVLIFLFRPLFRSIRIAEKILREDASVSDLKKIPFLPIQRLASGAVQQMKRERELAQVRVAQQVGHDIRSPLSALEMVSYELPGIPEDRRMIVRNAIRRIRDIANLLSHRSPDWSSPPEEHGAKPLETVLVFPLLDELVSEKRFEFREKPGIDVEFDQDDACYGLSIRVDPLEFKRAVSNLINNSVEALDSKGGVVRIRAGKTDADEVFIEVADTGHGMSPDLLSRIGVRGMTFGKPGGSGLGLAHAKEFAARSGGRIAIESEPGAGTAVRILLPRAEAPEWFARDLRLDAGATVIVVDDEQTVHQVWKNRIETGGGNERGILVRSFFSPEAVRVFCREEFLDLEDPVFLVDYEISGPGGTTGLDLISGLGIESRSCLVTSHYAEPEIIAECVRRGVRMIPKSMSGFVPIRIA